MSTFDDAVDAIDRAAEAVTTWCDSVRQDAEQRVGSADPDAVTSDPAYAVALTVFEAIRAAQKRIDEIGDGR